MRHLVVLSRLVSRRLSRHLSPRRWPRLPGPVPAGLLVVTIVLVPCCLAVLLAPACRSSAPRVDRAERMVLVSYDGMGADLAWSWIDGEVATAPDGLSGMARHGLAARRMRAVDPTLTSVNHVSLISGAYPERTGVVSNVFHRPPGPIDETVSGFLLGSEVETLCEAVRRQGGRAGVLLWPGIAGPEGEAMVDFGFHWPRRPLAPAEVLELEPGAAEITGELPSQDAVPPLMWRVSVRLAGSEPEETELLVVSTDGTPDGRPHYDTVGIRLADRDSWALLSELEWTSVELMARGPDDPPGESYRYGSWCKTLRVDRYRGGVRLLRGALYRLQAYPEPFAEQIEPVVGFWPGPPDDALVEEWWIDATKGIDLDTYLEQTRRLDRYLDAAAQWVIANESFRLLLVYHPSPDEYQHTSLIVDPDQWAYSPGKALAAREGLKQVGISIDRSVSTLWKALDPVHDALVVLSDHGLMPVTDVVRVNQALAEAGLVSLDDKGARVSKETPMLAHCSGASAHIYLANPTAQVGGASGAAGPDSGRDEMLRRAAKALADIHAEDGPVVERILTRTEAGELGLDHPATGDLVVFLRPGFAARCGLGEAVVEPARTAAQHGFLSHHPEMDAVFLARGGAIRRSRRDEVRAPEVAYRIAGWLGIEPPNADGRLRETGRH